MDIDEPSSPPRLRQSSLPPSSMPDPTPRSTTGSSQGGGTPARRSRPRDALELDDEGAGAQDTNDDAQAASQRRRRRARGNANQLDGSVPIVKDAIGETLADEFYRFLKTFTEDVALPGTPRSEDDLPVADDASLIYIEQIHLMKQHKLSTLYVDFSHVRTANEVLAETIASKYYRAMPYLKRAVADLVAEYEPTFVAENPNQAVGGSLHSFARDFAVAFYNLKLVSAVRDLRTDRIGTLMAISGTVTRTSEVRPELLYGSFVCEACGGIVSDVEQQFKYTEPSLCPNVTCGNRTAWQLQLDTSKFTDWQKVRIQENPNEIPTGSMPRSLDVILRGELVERAKAGDKCVFTGTFIVVPDVSQLGLPGGNQAQLQREAARSGGAGASAAGAGGAGVTGLKSLGVRDLSYRTAFLACMVQDADGRAGANVRGESEEVSGEAFFNSLTEPEFRELASMLENPHIYAALVESIAPTVYGHELVKKGLLLQLLGGVHKETAEGMRLRGDINICVVGDPSTSKSQFLKYICSFLPRAVYTSGKASSAAGLTAAVVRDEETGEFTIEAGALMLADNGICAIDEFDKMDVADQVAIHEAMEQQTISIAKAGIHATLNARTSILAAANPIGGRYDRKKSLRANISLSSPIMSRFDLFFVVLDECEPRTDLAIARHIVGVHRLRDAAIQPEFSTEALQRYIRYARTFAPRLTPEASDVLVEKYRILRSEDASGNGARSSFRITVRQLESMIRLSEAIARAHCSAEIKPMFVREAYALLKQSIVRVEEDDIDFDEEELAGERPGDARPRADGTQDEETQDQDMEMDTEPTEPLYSGTGHATSSSHAQSSAMDEDSQPQHEQPQQKKRMVITHDRYMQMQSLVVLHLAQVERETGHGLDADALTDWYLELREEVIEDLDELEREKELFGKVLRKLVKDSYLITLTDTVQSSLPQTEEDQGPAPTSEHVFYMVHPSVDTDSSQ